MGIALITGASGVLGRHLLAQWTSDLEPVAVEHRFVDLLTPGSGAALVARLRPQAVIHLAWTASGTTGYRTSRDNERWVDASLEMAEASRVVGARFLATGTALDSSAPGDAYSSAKRRLGDALKPRFCTGRITWLRPYYVVDPDRRRPELVAQALAAAEADVPIVLRTPGAQHDFVHASDAARAIAVALDAPLVGEVPIGSGTTRSVRDLVEALGVPWQPAQEPPKNLPHHHEAADTSGLRARGWQPIRTEELFNRD